MKKPIVLLMAVVLLAGLLTACGDDRKNGVTIPPGAEKEYEVEHEKTFEVDESKDGSEYKYSWGNTIP